MNTEMEENWIESPRGQILISISSGILGGIASILLFNSIEIPQRPSDTATPLKIKIEKDRPIVNENDQLDDRQSEEKN